MTKAKNTTRRRFLGQAASAAFGVPLFVSCTAIGKGGAVSASERIAMGVVGTGKRGRGVMGQFLNQKDVQVVAVCDVDTRHREQAQAGVNKKYGNRDCAAYSDFRELVARDDLDAVLVATPDHWHALASIAAANAGKDVYCEKPLANSIGEGRAICRAVEKNERILQTGCQERSGVNARFACQLVREGRIGKLKRVVINLPDRDRHHLRMRNVKDAPPTAPTPEGLDYNFWLGHTPKVPYRPFMADDPERRCHFWWRFILAYGGGEMTDRGAHVIDLAQLGMQADNTGPVEIEARGVQTKGSLFDVFWDYQFVNTYANGLQMIGSTQGPRGVRFEGEAGTIFIHVHGQRVEADPASLLDDLKTANRRLHPLSDHLRSFLNAVKTRKPSTAFAESGHRTASICHLNNIAMRLGRKLKWDPKAERFSNDEEANGLITPKMRAPWTLQY